MTDPTTKTGGKPVAERYFYAIATLLLLVLTLVGFQLFYFHNQMYPGRPITPPIKTWIITHGVAMSLWILLAIIQPFLVAGGNRKLHMTLGKVAAGIAIGLVLLGVKLGVASCQVAPPDLMYGALTPKQFLIVPVGDISLFALFLTAGIIWRKRPDIHKPMMFLASLAAVGAAISRMDFLNHLYLGTIWEKLFGFFFFTVVAGAVFFTAKCIVFRRFDKWFAAGYGFLVFWFLIVTQGATTQVWDGIASLLLW